MSDVQEVKIGLQRSADGQLVEFGVALQNGGFFPFAASRAGDYDEAVAADAQPQPQPESSQPEPQPAQQEPQPEANPAPTAVPEGEGQ